MELSRVPAWVRFRWRVRANRSGSQGIQQRLDFQVNAERGRHDQPRAIVSAGWQGSHRADSAKCFPRVGFDGGLKGLHGLTQRFRHSGRFQVVNPVQQLIFRVRQGGYQPMTIAELKRQSVVAQNVGHRGGELGVADSCGHGNVIGQAFAFQREDIDGDARSDLLSEHRDRVLQWDILAFEGDELFQVRFNLFGILHRNVRPSVSGDALPGESGEVGRDGQTRLGQSKLQVQGLQSMRQRHTKRCFSGEQSHRRR